MQVALVFSCQYGVSNTPPDCKNGLRGTLISIAWQLLILIMPVSAAHLSSVKLDWLSLSLPTSLYSTSSQCLLEKLVSIESPCFGMAMLSIPVVSPAACWRYTSASVCHPACLLRHCVFTGASIGSLSVHQDIWPGFSQRSAGESQLSDMCFKTATATAFGCQCSRRYCTGCAIRQ